MRKKKKEKTNERREKKRNKKKQERREKRNSYNPIDHQYTHLVEEIVAQSHEIAKVMNSGNQ